MTAGDARRRKRHWYFVTTEFCPQCGSTRVTRERRYGRRPAAWTSRHEDVERWDYCD